MRKHKIFWFDVTMADILGMQVDECTQKLVHDHGGLSFIKMLSLEDKVK